MHMNTKNYIRIFLWLLMLIGGAVVGIYFDKIYFKDLFDSLYFHITTFVLGYFLLKLIIKASRNTGKFLAGRGRQGNLPRMETNRLVTEGVYGLMRHPMHFGLWFFPLAFALLVGSPTFIFFIAPLEMFLMLLLIKIWEEPEAEKKFGEAYREYKKRVPFFCFKPDCIKALLEEKEG